MAEHRRFFDRWIVAAAVVALAASACGTRSDEPSTSAADPGGTVTEPITPGSTNAPTTTSTPLSAAEPTWSSQELLLVEVAQLDKPLALVGRSGTGDLYVGEKGGRVRQVTRTTTKNQPDRFAVRNGAVLDISDEVSSASEQGLLDIVFSSDGRHLFVSFTDRAGNNVIDRYTMDGDNVATGTRIELLRVEQPFSNHNGGGLAFGPDGFLYIGIGDGGRSGDPLGSGQDPSTMLGSILRIDPDGASGDSKYSIPDGNPYVDGGGAPEVWLYGVRNPWRFSFDSTTGDLWIADVGQNRFEEVNLLRAADGGGFAANLGWNQIEGFEPYEGGTEPADHTRPILVYGHENDRCSVTGGAVYRGELLPVFDGVYLFGDYCSGEMFGAQTSPGGVIFRNLGLQLPRNVLSSFGTDENGEMYVLSLDGGVFRIEPAPAE
ncbi:MAG: hypothetical protein HKN03_06220 [Acidimicrobiales bacterium]|nr:hypothetical protein [Acidimicrobiales bacterium]